ncbi:MAG: hypothetical protein E4H41_00005, partial [Gemmatimonadales bacterium]
PRRSALPVTRVHQRPPLGGQPSAHPEPGRIERRRPGVRGPRRRAGRQRARAGRPRARGRPARQGSAA